MTISPASVADATALIVAGLGCLVIWATWHVGHRLVRVIDDNLFDGGED